MNNISHGFTETILNILQVHYGNAAQSILANSELIQYLNIKTKAANRGSKSRPGLANHYAIYVLIEDYVKGNFQNNETYKDYEGVQFILLFKRQRELPFGSKLQNHALNHRLNEEFKKYFPTSQYLPIIRDIETNRYWINENLLKLNIGGKIINLAESIKQIIEAYVLARQKSFNDFMTYCEEMLAIYGKDHNQAIEFIKGLLQPNVDARIFEIVSYSILKEYYAGQVIYWGWSPDELKLENLALYKTGRTNANDGGIDFVMKPLGRLFQVTETIDAGKYFLDIDKVQKYPITFVVKSDESVERIKGRIEEQARVRYLVEAVIKKYMECVEEIINIQEIISRYDSILQAAKGDMVIKEIVLQSRLEFNVLEEEELVTDISEEDSLK